MGIKNKRKKNVMHCQRCGCRMIFEKYYDVSNVFFGWHCIICGEILDPVILLHRLSNDAHLRIPEEEQDVIHLVKKYLHSKSKQFKLDHKVQDLELLALLKEEPSMN